MIVFERLCPLLACVSTMLPCVVFAQIQPLPLQSLPFPKANKQSQSSKNASREWGLKKNNQPSFWTQLKQSISVISSSMCLQMKTKESQKGLDSQPPVSTTCFDANKNTWPSSTSLTAVSNWQKIKKNRWKQCSRYTDDAIPKTLRSTSFVATLLLVKTNIAFVFA